MRRPSPLPQSGPPAAQPSRPAMADESHATAPILPIALAGAPGPETAARPAAAPTAEPPTGDAADDIGMRDVWFAARARRRALRAEVRRFTARQRKRRAVWIGAVASVALLAATTVGVAYSPLFAVEQVTVVGASQLDPDAVQEALSGQIGTPLASVDESEVKAALVGFPLVETYTLEARPPHELVVRIIERTPVGYIETPAGFTLVDAAGVALSTAPAPGEAAPVLTVQGGVGSPAFRAVGQVMRTLPAAIRAQVTAVAATSPDDVRLSLGGSNATIVWGSADDSATKAVVLETAMAARPPDTVAEYDVSSSAAVVIR